MYNTKKQGGEKVKITDIKIRRVNPSAKMKAIISVTFDDAIVIHDIKIIDNQGSLFLAMPSQRLKNGEFRDIAHPINSEAREKLERAIFQEYHNFLAKMQVEEFKEPEVPAAGLDS
ncbi:MAG: septation regulator SpoVG [Tissierellia bacterium]|nr:septation regulator SpoVG [Tissierellia bacterium]